MLTLERRKILKAEQKALSQRLKDRVNEARALGYKLAAETWAYAEIDRWQRVGSTAADHQAVIGTEVGGFTLETQAEVRNFLDGVNEVCAELDREPQRRLTEDEKDARDKANGWKIHDPEGAERRMQERRDARRALIADYERRKAAGEDVEYPA